MNITKVDAKVLELVALLTSNKLDDVEKIEICGIAKGLKLARQ